jgi:hypothetical protein
MLSLLLLLLPSLLLVSLRSTAGIPPSACDYIIRHNTCL